MRELYQTDHKRWREMSTSWGERFPERSKLAGQVIPNGSRVLDLGAGTMVLKRYLKEDCIYQPCDLYSRDSNCLEADLNKREFPEGKKYDWVTLIGLFQFLKEPEWVLNKCRDVASHLYVTFSPRVRMELKDEERVWREGEGWFNHHNLGEYIQLVERCGWKVEKIAKLPANVVLVASQKISARTDDPLNEVKNLAKVELHRHLEGSLRPEMLLGLAQKNRINIPFRQPEDWKTKLRFNSFEDFIPPFLVGVKCLRELDDFEAVAYDLGLQMVEENILYAEVTFTAQFYLGRPFPMIEILRALNRGREKVKLEFGRHINWVIDLVRNRPKLAREAFDSIMALDLKSLGVVGLGLGGPEIGFPVDPLRDCFVEASRRGLAILPHAGESGGASSIREAINLGAKRLGHGVQAHLHPELLRELIEKEIHLEVCIGSNVALKLFSEKEHPVRELFDSGCRMSLNSDDPVLFQSDMNEEWKRAIEHHHFELKDLRKLNKMALEDSMASPSLKRELSLALSENRKELD